MYIIVATMNKKYRAGVSPTICMLHFRYEYIIMTISFQYIFEREVIDMSEKRTDLWPPKYIWYGHVALCVRVRTVKLAY